MVTPKIIAKIKNNHSLQYCTWCRLIANIDHICECLFTISIRNVLVKWNKLLWKLKLKDWIFGSRSETVNQIIWVVNFAIYKAHLQAIEGYHETLVDVVSSKTTIYGKVFPILDSIEI